MENQPTPKPVADFAEIFAQVNAAGQIESIAVTRQINEQAETIRLIAQATERSDTVRVVTYFST